MISRAEWLFAEPAIREDNETIGYVARRGDKWHALTLLGTTVNSFSNAAEAEHAIHDLGLSWMIERMWCRIPRPLTVPGLAYEAIDPDNCEWERVSILEITRTRALIRPEHAYPDEIGCYVELTLPVNDEIRFTDPMIDGMSF